jgi:hypothetical protein
MNYTKKLGYLSLLASVSLVAAISFGLARGDHGGGGDHEGGGRETGGTHQTWCDIDPSCNGWNGPGPNTVMSRLRAQYTTETQAYTAMPPRIIYAQRSPVKVVYAQHRPVRVVRVAVPKPLNLLPPKFAGLFD